MASSFGGGDKSSKSGSGDKNEEGGAAGAGAEGGDKGQSSAGGESGGKKGGISGKLGLPGVHIPGMKKNSKEEDPTAAAA